MCWRFNVDGFFFFSNALSFVRSKDSLLLFISLENLFKEGFVRMFDTKQKVKLRFSVITL